MPPDRAAETQELRSDGFDGLFRDTGRDLWRALFVYTGRRELAEEIVAEAFTRYLERSDRVRDPRAWLYRVAFRLANEELRRERRRPTPEVDPYAPREDELAEVLDVLRRLPPRQRAAIVLHYRLDMPVREVAEVL